ncbi:FAD-dependent oxidoreductase [Gordonia soli]|uniref:3-oxosteroid 1-dehydrogenase n=1 Tax=Gordonia soli NBRC 108243 TaxID=1223545 RepID=M0QNZ1_9ACTN|nr:FAD-dependent oxidoreductase [Gordonia soli]GAC70355.1 putative 3-ketosteroid delta(1)-dehydrogenase [Gordonia soli NBRC 108243]
MTDNEETYDVIVVGSGGGGLIGGYIAASRGLRTLIIEKTDKVGGTTSYSGAGLWFPGSAPILRAGIAEDDLEVARGYLRAAVGDDSRADLQDAYLSAAGRLIDELERNPRFGTFFHQPVPDYYGSLPGATPHGRTIFPPPVTVAELGETAELVRRSIYTERYGHTEDDELVGGRALIGRALAAFLGTGNGTLLTETELTDLIVESDRVVGIDTRTPQGPVRFRAERGVLLAAGGFEHNAELRVKYGAIPSTGDWSDGVDSNVGDALVAGIAVGAETELLDEAWYVPGVVQPDGKPIFNHATRGGIWVNAAGERFTNETAPYDQAGHAIRDGERDTEVQHAPTHWIFDQKQLSRDGFGAKSPDTPLDPEWFTSGALRKADTLEELAEIIGVPAEALRVSVEKFNGYVATGVDEEFHRGESAWDQMCQFIVGYPALPEQNYIVPIEPEGPNPLLVSIDSPPYYAATLLLSDIGTKGGLKTDVSARVLRADGQPIAGLYATGNTMAAMSGGVYPGAGTPIGSALAFAYLAALDLAEPSL